MKISLLLIMALCFVIQTEAQRRKSSASSRTTVARAAEIGKSAMVLDETLSVLRDRPSLHANAIQRMRRGRVVKILGVAHADGVTFYRVAAPPSNVGWVQADAVFGKFRASDEERMARLVQAQDGFEQLETASHFLSIYPKSSWRPPILLLYGDLLEVAAVKLSKDANSLLKRPEMAATAAPMHSYYLNFNRLDRYRRLGIKFHFNTTTRQYHYDGASWLEIVEKFPGSNEAVEAAKRLESMKANLAKGSIF